MDFHTQVLPSLRHFGVFGGIDSGSASYMGEITEIWIPDMIEWRTAFWWKARHLIPGDVPVKDIPLYLRDGGALENLTRNLGRSCHIRSRYKNR
jgi:hypothetical protein